LQRRPRSMKGSARHTVSVHSGPSRIVVDSAGIPKPGKLGARLFRLQLSSQSYAYRRRDASDVVPDLGTAARIADGAISS
jgi:hypothetical protein